MHSFLAEKSIAGLFNPGFQSKPWAGISERFQRYLAYPRFHTVSPHDPRPHGSEKLSAEEKYRVRQGDYRVVYSVDDDQRIVLIVKVGHRKEVYR